MKKLLFVLLLLGVSRISGIAQLNYLDPAFADGGFSVISESASDYSFLSHMHLLPDGKILVQHVRAPSLNEHQIFLYQFLPDGSPDPAFGVNGSVMVTANAAAVLSNFKGFEVLNNGKILVGYISLEQWPNTLTTVITRLNKNGSPDMSFGVNGIAQISDPQSGIGHQHTMVDFKIQSNGTIAVIYNSLFSSYFDYGFRYFNPNGTLAPGSETVSWWATENWDEYYAGAIMQPGNNIVIGGTFSLTSGSGLNDQFLLGRFEPDGYLNDAFGNQGFVFTNISPDGDRLRTLQQHNGGRILAVGEAPNEGLLLARYSSEGIPDVSLGGNGTRLLTALLEPNSNSGLGVSRQMANGSFAVAGNTYNPTMISEEGAILRLLENGAPDTTFSPTGVVYLPKADLGLQTSIHAVQVLSDRRIQVCGVAIQGSTKTLFIARFLPEVNATVWYPDLDQDQYGDSQDSVFAVVAPAGYLSVSGDCDDTNAQVHPGATEICTNGIDDNCNGLLDEDLVAPVVLCNTEFVLALNQFGEAELPASVFDAGSYDECGGPVLFSNAGDTLIFNCSDLGAVYFENMFVLDGAFNVGTCSAAITVVDITPPVVICPELVALTLGNSGFVNLTPEMFDQGSYDNCGITAYAVFPIQLTAANIGTNQVSLMVTDNAGNTNSCIFIVDLEDKPSAVQPVTDPGNRLTIAPNPAKDQVTIYLSGAAFEPGMALELLDCLGRIVQKTTVEQPEHTINVETLPAGIYTLRASGNTGMRFTGQLIKG